MFRQRLMAFWKEWVYDPNHPPVAMQPHPHAVFKVGARAAACIFGTILPFGFFVLRNEQAMKNPLQWVMLAAIWVLVVYKGVTCEEPTFGRYIRRGLVSSIYLVVLHLSLP